jgi:hypothetical protein
VEVVEFQRRKTEWERLLGDYIEHWRAVVELPAEVRTRVMHIRYTAEAVRARGKGRVWTSPSIYEVSIRCSQVWVMHMHNTNSAMWDLCRGRCLPTSQER